MKDRNKALADLGNEIRLIREEQGLTLEDVTKEIKIRTNFLEDIEKGNFENFPGNVYVRGFIQTYLNFLGTEELWSQYKPYMYTEETIDTSDLVLGTLTAPARGFRHASRFWLIIVLILFIAGLGFYGITMLKDNESSLPVAQINKTPVKEGPVTQVKLDKPALDMGKNDNLEVILQSGDQSIAEAGLDLNPVSPDELQAALEGVSPDAVAAIPAGDIEEETPAEETPEPAVVTPSVLRMETTRDCWVKVATADRTIYQGIIKANGSREFEITERVNVTYGRPASINVTFMGEELGKPGTGGVVEKWFYSPEGEKGRIQG